MVYGQSWTLWFMNCLSSTLWFMDCLSSALWFMNCLQRCGLWPVCLQCCGLWPVCLQCCGLWPVCLQCCGLRTVCLQRCGLWTVCLQRRGLWTVFGLFPYNDWPMNMTLIGASVDEEWLWWWQCCAVYSAARPYRRTCEPTRRGSPKTPMQDYIQSTYCSTHCAFPQNVTVLEIKKQTKYETENFLIWKTNGP